MWKKQNGLIQNKDWNNIEKINQNLKRKICEVAVWFIN